MSATNNNNNNNSVVINNGLMVERIKIKGRGNEYRGGGE
jgi:hypothetical protein